MSEKLTYIEGVPHLDLNIDDVHQGLEAILKVIRPAWNVQDVQIEDKSSGYINRNYHCSTPNCNDPIFVRLMNDKMPGHIESATSVMRCLKRARLGAQLLLTFNTGVVMEFIRGEPVIWNKEFADKIKEPIIWRSYAREMAKYHATVKMSDAEEFKVRTRDERLQRYRQMLEGCLASGVVPKESLKGLPDVDEIIQGLVTINQQILEAGSEECFCHSDSNPTNLLILEDKTIFFVDYDDCSVDFPCIEMSGAFATLSGVDDFRLENMPNDQEQDTFIREYLSARREFDENFVEINEKLIEFWKFLLRKASLYTILSGVGIVMMLQNITTKNLGLSLAHTLYGLYKEKKDEILSESFSWD